MRRSDDPFEAARPRLKRLAYRMLGEMADAEDAVQDAWLRWQGAEQGAIADATGWLVTVTTRLCLDRLRAEKARREAYRGPWLPSPLIEDLAEDPVERAEEVSVAFLLALQRLSPLERAVFLLREVFDEDYAKVARTLDRSEAAVRQLAARAREHVRAARPRFEAPPEEKTAKLVAAFLEAARGADLDALSGLLAEDAVLITDGGGKRKAALRPMVGREDVMRLLVGLASRGNWPSLDGARAARINGYPGVIARDAEGVTTFAFQPGADGRIAAIYAVRNPDKLAGIEL
jgi:RNA polymerase sigma-70 factor (ECF subfamily)